MLSKANKIIAAVLLIALTIYVIVLNNEPITIWFGPGSNATAYGGVIYISVFIVGFLSASLIALAFGVRSWMREKNLQSRDRKRQDFFESVMKARGYLASNEWAKARDQWERIIRREPSNILARVELSRSLEGAGDEREALRILDAARAEDPNNTEVLFRAAELNIALNNRTAAIDNLALILIHHPNRRAAVMARDLSADLGRIEDAAEYQKQVEKLGSSSENSKAVFEDLAYRKVLKLENAPIQSNGHPAPSFEQELRTFVKAHPEHAPGLYKLAELEVGLGNIDSASQLLIKAGKATGSACYWQRAADLWLEKNNPERALAVAKSSVKDVKGRDRVDNELMLIRTYIAVNLFDDAKAALDRLPAIASDAAIAIDSPLAQKINALYGLLLKRSGDYRASADIWERQASGISETSLPRDRRILGQESAPAPRLSTP